MDRIDSSVDDLRRCLARIDKLAKWLDFKDTEKSAGLGSVIWMYDPNDFDMKVEAGFFLLLSAELRRHLSQISCGKVSRKEKELAELEKEFWEMGVSVRPWEYRKKGWFDGE